MCSCATRVSQPTQIDKTTCTANDGIPDYYKIKYGLDPTIPFDPFFEFEDPSLSESYKEKLINFMTACSAGDGVADFLKLKLGWDVNVPIDPFVPYPGGDGRTADDYLTNAFSAD